MEAALPLLVQALRISVPYALAALGGSLCERAGVVNLALEGLMLLGAFGAALGCHLYGGAAGIGAALCVGLLLGLLYALVTIRLRANQIVAGVALNLIAAGGTRVLCAAAFGTIANSPRIDGTIGTAPVVGVTLLLAALGQVVMFRTALGLRLRAVGEHPEGAESLGVSVARTRLWAVLLSGALAALAGAFLAYDQHQWSDGMSAGRGYIAVAAVILGRWSPLGALLASLLFGAAETAQIALQTAGLGLPGPLVQAIPYVLTMVAISGVIGGAGRARPPAALGRPFPD
jgi:general nucleoside transport system permease protein